MRETTSKQGLVTAGTTSTQNAKYRPRERKQDRVSHEDQAKAYNGVAVYLSSFYKFEASAENVNQFMKEYRESRGSVPSEHANKNALYVQKDFGSFVKYCSQKLERRPKWETA